MRERYQLMRRRPITGRESSHQSGGETARACSVCDERVECSPSAPASLPSESVTTSMADRVVSEELKKKIVQFQEVTGTEDMEEARSQLEGHGWDLAAAVQNHRAIKESHGGSGGSGGGFAHNAATSSSQATPQSSRSTIAGYHGFRGRRGFFPWGLMGWMLHLVTWPLRVIQVFMSSLLLFLYRIICSFSRRLTEPLEDVLRFIRGYEAEYGQQHPAFFQGSYSQALSHAKNERKFLLVYLHFADHQDTPLFCRTVLSDPTLVEYIDTSMVFWGCSVTSAEGQRVSQALQENSNPFLALVVERDNRGTVVGRLEELIPAPQLTNRLQTLVRENEAQLVVARAEK